MDSLRDSYIMGLLETLGGESKKLNRLTITLIGLTGVLALITIADIILSGNTQCLEVIARPAPLKRRSRKMHQNPLLCHPLKFYMASNPLQTLQNQEEL
jgi:hypothetical protein